MSSLKTHLEKAQAFRESAARVEEPCSLVLMWFWSAYHLIEACAAKQRVHIQKHGRVPDELRRNPVILGSRGSTVADAFRYLDYDARVKFVYGDSGTKADFEKARISFETVEAVCREVLG